MKSTAGFVLCLIGGIFSILLSLIIGLMTILFGVLSMSIPETSLVAMQNFSTTVTVVSGVLALWFLIFGILTITFSIKINSDEKVKSGSWACLVFGILTVNVLAFIGAIIGLAASGRQSNLSQYPNLQANSLATMSSSNMRNI